MYGLRRPWPQQSITRRRFGIALAACATGGWALGPASGECKEGSDTDLDRQADAKSSELGKVGKAPTLLLCIPEPGPDRVLLIREIARNNANEAIAAGGILMELGAKRHAELKVFERDQALAGAFEKASAHAIDAPTVSQAWEPAGNPWRFSLEKARRTQR
jgi:hypothetical protein